MNKMKLLTVLSLVMVLPGAVFAELVDFRDGAWAGAAGQESWTVSYYWGDVTVSADPYNSLTTHFLVWDSVDGLGVTSPYDTGPHADPTGEPDEIDWPEPFRISFDSPTYVYGVNVADLYQREDPGTGGEWVSWPIGSGYEGWDGSGEAEGEGGSVIPDEDWGARAQFWGQDSDQTNGEQYIALNRFATTLDFTTVCSNSDYSVVGVRVVPVPGAVLLGMLGLSVAGMRLRRRQT